MLFSDVLLEVELAAREILDALCLAMSARISLASWISAPLLDCVRVSRETSSGHVVQYQLGMSVIVNVGILTFSRKVETNRWRWSKFGYHFVIDIPRRNRQR